MEGCRADGDVLGVVAALWQHTKTVWVHEVLLAPPQSLPGTGEAMVDRTPAAASEASLSPAVDPSSVAWSSPGSSHSA